MSGAVVYIERTGAGAALKRVRLVIGMSGGGRSPAGAAGGAIDRAWTAPADGSLAMAPTAADAAAPTGPGPAVAAARAAARWVAESLAALDARRIAAVVIDGDGGVCAWLSAPSPRPEVIAASIQQGGLAGADGAGGGGAGRLLSLTTAEMGAVGGDLGGISVQALALPESPARSPRLTLRRPSDSAVGERRRRFAVLALPDAPVRVFLDELDALNLEVERVLSLWHAAALAWDPASAAGPSLDLDSGDGHLVAQSPPSAVVLIDPDGRLTWAWSRAGELTAGGSMRLKSITPPTLADAPAPGPLALGEPQAGAARRLSVEETAAPAVLECSTTDIGRLTLDWLSWSAQLGEAPERIICLGPATLGDDQTDGPSAAWAGRAIGQAWPGAAVDLAEHDDPIGATLTRLARASVTRADTAPDAPPRFSDPRASLVALSTRPGRALRRMMHWAALGILTAAAVLAVVGYKLGGIHDASRDAIAQADQARAKALVDLEPLLPGLTKQSDPEGAIRARLQAMSEEAAKLRPVPPVLAETARVLTAIDAVRADLLASDDPEQRGKAEQVRLSQCTITALFGTVTIEIPDTEVGPRILERLQASSTPSSSTTTTTGGTPAASPALAQWKGSFPARAGAEGRRVYILTLAWPEPTRRTTAQAPPPAPPRGGA